MTIENLQIEVQATSNQAAQNLERLESILQRIDALGNNTGFDKLYKKLKKIASLNFSGVESGLNTVNKTTERMSRTTSRVDRFAKTVKKVREEIKSTREEFSKYQKASNPLLNSTRSIVPMSYRQSSNQSARNSSFTPSFGGNLGDGRPNWTRWNPWGSKQMFDNMYDAWSRHDFGNVPTSHRLGDGTIELGADQWKEIGTFESKFRDLKDRIRDATGRLRDYARSVRDADKDTKKANKTLGAMKTILMYSLLFSAVSAVMKGTSEGLQNIAMYSEEANATLTEYKTTSLQLKNTIGSALIPVLQTFYPLIQLASNALIDVANSINMVFSALNGSESFIKAKKYTDDYAKSLGKLKGMAGMDQIHTIGNSYNYDDMFEEVKMDGWDIAGALANLTAMVTVLLLIKDAKIGETFIKMGTGIKNAYKYLKNAATWKKAGIAIAALSVEAVVCYNAFHDMTLGTKTVGEGLLELIPTLTLTGVAMYAMCGPAGLVIGAIVALTSAALGAAKAQIELRDELINKTFYNAAGDMAVTLDELANSFNAAWGEAESLSAKTSAATDTINDCADQIEESQGVINKYLEVIQETGKLSETEASDMTNHVTSMVDNLEVQLNSRMDSILSTFKGLSKLARTDFIDDLGEMETAFLEFQKLLGDTTAGYEEEIKDLIDKSTTDGLNEEEVKKLQEAVNKLAALNITYSDEQYQFDSLLEKARSGGIDFGSTDETTAFLSELSTSATGYLSHLKTAYDDSDRHIKELMAQNEALYKQGAISETDYNRFNAAFADARTKLAEVYEATVEDVISEVEAITEVIQQSALKNTSEVAKSLQKDYENASWWDKNVNFFSPYYEGEVEYVSDGLGSFANKILAPINDAVNSLLQSVGSGDSAWLSDAIGDVREDYIYSEYHHNDLTGGDTKYYYTGTSIEDAINSALGESANAGSGVIGSSSYKDPLLGEWTSGVHPDYPYATDWMKNYGVQMTKNEATVLRRELARRNANGQNDTKIADLAKYIEWMTAQGYATGGFPEDGLFMANHSELVGKFSNGKTAVANNEQIVAGIARGVSEASSEQNDLLREQNKLLAKLLAKSGNGSVSVSTITKGLERQNRRNGKVIVPVGN